MHHKPDRRIEGMRYTQVHVFYKLHIVRGNNHADITQFLHFSTRKTRQADRG